PEVDDHDLAPQRRELERARPVQPLEVEIDRLRTMARGERARDRRLVTLHDLPDEQPEQRDDEPERCDLPGELERLHAATMNTVVPRSTVLKSHSASGMYIRMQPCEAE